MDSGNSGNQQQVEAGKAAPETEQQKQAPELVRCAKFLAASVTGFGVMIYGIGYLCHLGHHKMLGISHIEHPSDQIILDGVSFFILTPLCVFLSFCVSWLPWIIALLLLALFLSSRIITRAHPQKTDINHNPAGILKNVKTILVVLLHLIFFFLASVILSQSDLLLSTQNQTFSTSPAKNIFATISSHCPQLLYLLESSRSQSLYGLLFLLAAICSLSWIRYIVKSLHLPQSSEKISQLKVAARRAFLIVGFYFLLLFVSLSFCLYGFLVKSNRYPVIELQPTEANPYPAENLFVLGDSGSRTLLYSPDHCKIWWVESSEYLPVSRSKPPRSIFKTVESE